MRLRYRFETAQIGDGYMAVAVGEDSRRFGGMLRCSRTGAAILELLDREITEEQLVAELRKRYRAPEGVIERETRSLLELLRERQLLI